MTHDDLTTLLREDVTATEPHHGLDVMEPVRLGRRRLRARRVAGSGALAAVLAVGGVGAAAWLGGDDGARPGHGIDPVSARALADYDAQAMPQLLDDHVRAVLSRVVPDLGPATFVAFDGQDQTLPPALYDKASGMSVDYGSDEHHLSVSLAHSKGEAEGSAQRYCESGLSAGIYLSCEVSTGPKGETVISKLEAVRPQHVVGGQQTFMIVTRDQLTTTNPDRLYFDHEVKVVKSETLVTYVDERVKAPTPAAADAAFQVPVDDLVEIGTDPVLVIPAPPTDDSGCGPWTLDPDVSYC